MPVTTKRLDSPPSPALAPRRAELRAIEIAIRGFLVAHHPEARRVVLRMGRHRNVWEVVGSMTVLDLVRYLEVEFRFTVRPIDFVPHNFATIARMARFVALRGQPTPG
jgi:hypothetical protein